MRINLWTFLAATVMALGSSSITAEEAASAFGEDTLSGDWNGLRSSWSRKGLVVDIGYKWDMMRVARGGLQRGGRPIEHFDIRAALDLDKIAGWQDTNAFINFVYDGGDKTNRDKLGSLLGISNVEVATSTSRFYQAWIEKSFLEGSTSLLAGLYPIDTEFQALESAGVFAQSPYGAAPDIAMTRGPSIFNNPALGLRVKWKSPELGLYGMGALLDGVPGDPARPKGTHIRLQRGDGSMHIGEIGYREPSAPAGPGGEALESFGKYALGVWGYTAKVADLVDVDANGDPEMRRSNGWYALAERTLWRWPAGSLAGFARFGVNDGHSMAIKQFYNLGVRARGLLIGREDDVFGLAHTRAKISDRFLISQALNGITANAAESATEITYRIQVNKWLAVQPLMQWFRNPGADSSVPSATVIGMRVELVL